MVDCLKAQSNIFLIVKVWKIQRPVRSYEKKYISLSGVEEKIDFCGKEFLSSQSSGYKLLVTPKHTKRLFKRKKDLFWVFLIQKQVYLFCLGLQVPYINGWNVSPSQIELKQFWVYYIFIFLIILIHNYILSIGNSRSIGAFL